MTVRFFNTYEPVTDFYRALIPALRSRGIVSEVVVSATPYRRERESLAERLRGDGARVVEIPSGVSTADSRLKKLAVLGTYAVGATAHALAGRGTGLNFFLTQPPLFHVLGPALRHARAQPYCCLIMDLYPDVLAADGLLSADGSVFRMLRRTSRAALAAADRIFVIGRCMRERLIAEGIAGDRVAVIQNWANENNIRPVTRMDNPLAREWGIRDELVVLYSGNLGVAHRFDTLVAVAGCLNARTDVRFVIIGDGPRRAEVEAACRSQGLRNVLLKPFQPSVMMAYSQSLGDVHFISLRDPFSGLLVPSKAYSAMAAGRAILYEGAGDGEIARMVDEERIGHVLSPGDAGAMATFIMRMAANRSECQALGRRARTLAEGRYSASSRIASYVSELSGLLSGSRLARDMNQ